MNGFSPRHASTCAADCPLRLLLALALCLLALPVVLRAAPPGWWTGRGVIDASKEANDFAALNQGQAKQLAQQATAELDEHLPGGAGDAVHAMVDGWAFPTPTTNDFSPVPLGALKALAQPFYVRLIAAGYTDAFPWSGKESQANNYAAANIGQAKNLFSFDVTYDGDADGLPDWWEKHWFGPGGVDPTRTVDWGTLTVLQAYQQGLNPHNFYNGHLPTLVASSGDLQEGQPGEYLPAPLVVQVADASGNALANAPVSFAVAPGGGQLQKSSSTPLVSSIAILTDANGQAQVFFHLPNAANATCLVTAQATSGGQAASTQFHESTNGGSGPPAISPFAPTNFISQASLDGSLDMTWENHTDDQTPIEVEIQRADGTWRLVATLPPNTTSFHWPSAQAQ